MIISMILQIIGYTFVFFCLLFVGFAFFNEVLIFSFLLVDYNLKSLYRPTEYPPASISRYIRNFWCEFFYVMRKYILLPYKWLDLSVNVKAEQHTAILFVHGYCRNQSDWLYMRKHMQSLQYPMFLVNLSPTFASIADITKESLIPKISQIKQATQCKHLILVAHSMGGLVSSYYSEYLDQENLVKAIITIGTPYFGTKISIVGNGANAKDMCPGSSFLTALHNKIVHSSKQYMQIASRFDNMIFPWQSAILEHTPKQQQQIIDFEAHLCMLRDQKVVAQVKQWVQELV